MVVAVEVPYRRLQLLLQVAVCLVRWLLPRVLFRSLLVVVEVEPLPPPGVLILGLLCLRSDP